MRERERERVTNSGSFPHRHKLLFGLVVTIGVLIYAAFNVWVYRYSSGSALSPKDMWQTVTKSGAGFGVLKGDSLPFEAQGKPQGVTFTDSDTRASTPTPTPRPTGPGEYACDPYGVCNKYSDEARRQYCSVTFADSRCLDQCGDKTKQCKQ